ALHPQDAFFLGLPEAVIGKLRLDTLQGGLLECQRGRQTSAGAVEQERQKEQSRGNCGTARGAKARPEFKTPAAANVGRKQVGQPRRSEYYTPRRAIGGTRSKHDGLVST